jgi:hypothetical protein
MFPAERMSNTVIVYLNRNAVTILQSRALNAEDQRTWMPGKSDQGDEGTIVNYDTAADHEDW